MPSKKSYIVTFKKPDATAADAASVLGVPANAMSDGVEALMDDVAPADDATMHFDFIGASVVQRTEKQADELRKSSDVAEVVEDFEVFALGDCDCGGDAFGEDAYAHDAYAGYDNAYSHWADPWADYYAAAPFGPLPPFPPFPPRPPIPIPPPLPHPCPRGTRSVCINRGPWQPPACFCFPDQPFPRPIPPRPTPIPVPRPQPIPWNISMVKADRVWNRVQGAGVNVAIIDTGIDNNHPDLTVSGGASFVDGVGSWDDDHGHGTHCAGIAGARNNATGIVGVAPRCNLYAVKVMRPTPDGRASGPLRWILAGMGWAQQNGMHVASMSLGSPVPTADATCTVAYQRAAVGLANAGCTVIAAAGNSGHTSTPWVGRPARCPGFMAVASVDRNGRRANTSSFGPPDLCGECGIEIAAPGVSINSTWPGGGYRVASGTSMACPHVAGAAALVKEQRPTWTPAQIRSRLRATAGDLGVPGNDPEYGSGLLDCERAILG